MAITVGIEIVPKHANRSLIQQLNHIEPLLAMVQPPVWVAFLIIATE